MRINKYSIILFLAGALFGFTIRGCVHFNKGTAPERVEQLQETERRIDHLIEQL